MISLAKNKEIIIANKKNARQARNVADSLNTHCVPASVLEIGARLNKSSLIPSLTEISTMMGINSTGEVDCRNVLSAISEGSKATGVAIRRLTYDPDSGMLVPENLTGVLNTASESIRPSLPCLVVLQSEKRDDLAHAIVIDGTLSTVKRRIEYFASSNWSPLAVVEFEKT